MAITLIVNPGSSSKKYALYRDMALIFSAHIEHDGNGITLCLSVNGVSDKCETLDTSAYQTSLINFIERAVSEGVIPEVATIDVVGVRVVAPGTFFSEHKLVDDRYMSELRKAVTRAPLHIPNTEKEMKIARQFLPQATIVAISDSVFHKDMPALAREYSFPADIAKAEDIYRFGYHGLSLASVCEKMNRQTGTLPERMIVCHIGSGVSVTAVKAGRSVDTTMGYAPGSGLIMGSRAGDVDAGATLALMNARNLKPVDAELFLQSKGGLRGIAGESDLRTLLDKRSCGEEVAISAIDHFVYGLAQAIAKMIIPLNGLDVLVFTATAGERSPLLRALVISRLSAFNVLLDEAKNEQSVSRDGDISGMDSKVKVLVVKTDESAVMLKVCQEFMT